MPDWLFYGLIVNAVLYIAFLSFYQHDYIKKNGRFSSEIILLIIMFFVMWIVPFVMLYRVLRLIVKQLR